MSLASSPFALSKRIRDDVEEGSPSGKRSRTFEPHHQVEQPQQAPPTANFASTLAQQRQEALERMEAGAVDREDVDMDGGHMSDSSTASNPRHPWNLTAPAMNHQHSTNSLSTSNHSSVASSMPTTPLDGSFNYGPAPSYPSHSNPTSFTDMNGTTHTFTSSSPPLSVYPPLPPTSENGPVSYGFVAQAYANAQAKQQTQGFTTTSGVVRIENPQADAPGETMMSDDGAVPKEEEQKPRVLTQPTYGYGWDYPRQSNAFALGGHLV
ncbi:hypothetical protein JCM3766R1_000399 [Sporobolomyces carnicolor]